MSAGWALADDSPPDALYAPRGQRAPLDRSPIGLRLAPYYAWANRGATSMAVWLMLDERRAM